MDDGATDASGRICEELLPILERQLYLYACYMLENMFSVRLGVKTIFFSKELVGQMNIVQNETCFSLDAG